MYLTSSGWNVPRPPGSNRSAITTHDRVIAQSIAELPRYDLRLHGLVRPRGEFFHEFSPVFHPGLRCLQKASLVLALQERNQLAQSVAAVAHQSHLDRVPQSD